MKTFHAEDLQKVVELLRGGAVIIFPTETSYGIGCDATNDRAVARIFKIKGRDESKGVPVILPPQSNPKEYILVSAAAEKIIENYWPGPLNLIAPRAQNSPISERCQTDGTQSVRKTAHPLAQSLAHFLGRPIVATSANRSGQSPLYTPADIIKAFKTGEVPDAFFEMGILPEVPPSTTVKVRGSTVEILRQGTIIL